MTATEGARMGEQVNAKDGWCCDGRTWHEHTEQEGHCCQPQNTHMGQLPDEGQEKARRRIGDSVT
ncbi:MAG: hypothetical protein KY447_01315 [Actinobacteria bacterium]|nr:hypothetical protein [Actinomycetota bacterium]MBW3641535.1 hypothetical protein [Actinomycetota bacterium]